MRDEIIRAVCVTTEATEHGCIDSEAMGTQALVDYTHSRDFKALKFKPGVKAVVFHVGEVPHEYWGSYVYTASTTEEKFERAFQCAVLKVENMPQSDGVGIADWAPIRNGKQTPMSTEQMQKFSPAERLEIGGVAYAHSFLPRRIDGCFQLHALCLEALRQQISRLVVASLSDAAETSTDEPSDQTSQPPAETESASATPAEGSG